MIGVVENHGISKELEYSSSLIEKVLDDPTINVIRGYFIQNALT